MPRPKAKAKSERKLVKLLSVHLEDAWEKSRWHSLQGVLDGLTQPEATWKPPNYQSPELWGFSGSILDILVHLAADSLVMIDHAFGDQTLKYDAVRERFKAQGSDLDAAFDLLAEAHAAAQKILSKLTDRNLQTKLGKKKTLRVYNIFTELIEHCLYHTGQINYIRCLWAGAKATSAEKNKAIARRVYEAFNTRDLDTLDELLHPDFVDHNPGPRQEPGVDGIKRVWTQIWAEFHDIRVLAEDILAEGDRVAARITFQHRVPEGREATARGRAMEILRIADGKVADLWNMIALA